VTAAYGADRVLTAEGLLRDFNAAGILNAADVHVAQRLGRLAGETDEAVLLAGALTVRSTRHGSVVLDLVTAEETTSRDDDEDDHPREPDAALTWPDRWLERVSASPLISTPEKRGPLRLQGTRLWLTRYWDQEAVVARELLTRSADVPRDLDLPTLAAGLQRLFARDDEDQQLASAVCALSRVSVLAGGPGTGKTTTVSRLLALLREQHPTWRIALAAPTGKASARLGEAVRSSTATLPPEDQARIGELQAMTLHKVLGGRPGARFKHDARNRLPYEVVVVDEASMVSLTLMARLLEALRPSTRLILVGDPDQLASVEAGAVLGDLVDRSTLGARTPAFAARLREVLPDATVPEEELPALRNGISALTVNRRFTATSEIHALATAIRDGEGETALTLLRRGSSSLELLEVADDAQPTPDQLATLRRDVEECGRALHAAATAGNQAKAMAALELHRVLCAHRRGPRGVQHWSALTAGWIAAAFPSEVRGDGRYVGEPLLVTTNDYEIDLFNGDTGVVVDDGSGGLIGVFGRGGNPIPVPLSRLGAVRPLHAMTIHRSQGSEFKRVTVLLASADSPLSTRETLYTAVTRAENFVRVIGSPEALLAAVARPAARATGLWERLR
jgi:exodeoxyribonuclease V alpha subunit